MLRSRRSALLGLLLVLAPSCGGSETASPSSMATVTTAGPAATTDPSAAGTGAARTVVPDVVVRDVATGADVNVRAAAARPDRPTLYWFWAPH